MELREMKCQVMANELLVQQTESWSLLKGNLQGLKHLKIKEFTYNGFELKVQFNPKRITSSGAKVDKASIEQRACFLCEENRPAEQKEVAFENDYQILCNPFPIFAKHFTIVKKSHNLQLISGEFDRFLALSKALPDLAIFYNGPKCGASAPDHMHFQAGNKGLMPIEKDISLLKKDFGTVLKDEDGLLVTGIDDGIRRFISIESKDEHIIQETFEAIYNYAFDFTKEPEPMMNMLAYYEEGWKVYIFLRGKHRPDQYFLEDEGNILFSPASVDMGGTLILPLEKDFEKIRIEDIVDMMQQVAISEKLFLKMTAHLKDKLA